MVSPRHLHGQRFRLQPRAVARLARRGCLKLAKLLAHPGAVGAEHAAFKVADQALERLHHFIASPPVLAPKRDGLSLRSEERRVGNECVSTCRYRWSLTL